MQSYVVSLRYASLLSTSDAANIRYSTVEPRNSFLIIQSQCEPMLLAIDTATQTASIAVYNVETNHLLSEWTWQARRRQTQDLLGTAQRILQQSEIDPNQISAVAVSTGPGSFTGVRIAISAAKGIGLGLPVPPQVVGIPTLSVTAAPLLAVGRSLTANVCVYLQAGRGRYNWAFASCDNTDAPELWAPSSTEHYAGTKDEFIASLGANAQRPILLAGEGRAELESDARKLAHVTIIDNISSLRRAGQLARLAAHYIAIGKTTSLSELSPLYLTTP